MLNFLYQIKTKSKETKHLTSVELASKMCKCTAPNFILIAFAKLCIINTSLSTHVFNTEYDRYTDNQSYCLTLYI